LLSRWKANNNFIILQNYFIYLFIYLFIYSFNNNHSTYPCNSSFSFFCSCYCSGVSYVRHPLFHRHFKEDIMKTTSCYFQLKKHIHLYFKICLNWLISYTCKLELWHWVLSSTGHYLYQFLSIKCSIIEEYIHGPPHFLSAFSPEKTVCPLWKYLPRHPWCPVKIQTMVLSRRGL